MYDFILIPILNILYLDWAHTKAYSDLVVYHSILDQMSHLDINQKQELKWLPNLVIAMLMSMFFLYTFQSKEKESEVKARVRIISVKGLEAEGRKEEIGQLSERLRELESKKKLSLEEKEERSLRKAELEGYRQLEDLELRLRLHKGEEEFDAALYEQRIVTIKTRMARLSATENVRH